MFKGGHAAKHGTFLQGFHTILQNVTAQVQQHSKNDKCNIIANETDS